MEIIYVNTKPTQEEEKKKKKRKHVKNGRKVLIRPPNVSWDEYARLRANKIISGNRCIAVTTSGELLYVLTIAYGTSRMFHVYKRDPDDGLMP